MNENSYLNNLSNYNLNLNIHLNYLKNRNYYLFYNIKFYFLIMELIE